MAQWFGILLTSAAIPALLGFLFWELWKTKFRLVDNRIRGVEEKLKEFKSDHQSIRIEDKEGIERQLQEIRKDLKDMPGEIMNLIQRFIK